MGLGSSQDQGKGTYQTQTGLVTRLTVTEEAAQNAV